jgi:hypothetical protein
MPLIQGIDSQLVVLNNLIDREFTVLDQSFYDYIAQRLRQVIQECGNRVPVLTGKPPPSFIYIKLFH